MLNKYEMSLQNILILVRCRKQREKSYNTKVEKEKKKTTFQFKHSKAADRKEDKYL